MARAGSRLHCSFTLSTSRLLLLLLLEIVAIVLQAVPSDTQEASPRECTKPNSVPQLRSALGHYNVAYHAGNESYFPERCFSVESQSSEGMDTTNIMYERENRIMKRTGTIVRYVNGKMSLSLDKEPTIAYSVHFRIVHGVLVVFICPPIGTDQVILIAYPRHSPQMSEVADRIAKALLPRPALAKVDHRGCENKKIIIV